MHTLRRTCIDCPEEVQCAENTTLKTLDVPRGYFRFTKSSSEIYACPHPNNCLGGKSRAGDSSCLRGAYGPLCELCATDYFLDADDARACVSCEGAASSSKVILLMSIAGAAFVSLVVAALVAVAKNFNAIKRFVDERKERIKAIGAKVTPLIVTMQIIILVNTNHKDLDGDGLPEPFNRFLDLLKFLTLDAFSFLPMGCVFGHVGHFQKLVVWTAGPFFAIVVAGIMICYVKKAATKKQVGC